MHDCAATSSGNNSESYGGHGQMDPSSSLNETVAKSTALTNSGAVLRRKLEEEEKCSVCLDSMGDGGNGDCDVDDVLTYCQDGCGRSFHYECIMECVRHKNSRGEKFQCPLCRTQWRENVIKVTTATSSVDSLSLPTTASVSQAYSSNIATMSAKSNHDSKFHSNVFCRLCKKSNKKKVAEKNRNKTNIDTSMFLQIISHQVTNEGTTSRSGNNQSLHHPARSGSSKLKHVC